LGKKKKRGGRREIERATASIPFAEKSGSTDGRWENSIGGKSGIALAEAERVLEGEDVPETPTPPALL